ncbi:G patch domain-containing protein 1-like [Physella acuta]|uniref:G patch domain-containing protein 1-like n=1 Tax=Physella acuta TaxID=109671 RepID=UPI0027DAF1D7|nr:G patch domain-containing protein 1-like [Physella acuta]
MAPSSDDSDEDDFVVIGTPLPPLVEGQPLKKYTAVEDLTARDKQGRRRFHGAFTGGFSAGYFNTVGTKEGFTPSSYVSSRSKKNEVPERSGFIPEDFMDEEDLEEHGIAPRKFATVGTFTSEERKRKSIEDATSVHSKATLGINSAIIDIAVPKIMPIGIKLLNKMGWREGQGVGPRQKKKKKVTMKKKDPTVKMYGCAPPPSDDDEDSDDFIPKDMNDVTFAPKDVTPIPLDSKDDFHGLGYHGLDPRLALPGSHIQLFGSTATRSSTGVKGIRGQAFGVGAFEDEDEDIYAVDNMSNYDITMQLDDEVDNKFGWTAPREHGKQTVPVTYVGKLLEGFKLSSTTLMPKKKYPPPALPAHFRPQHWFRKKRQISHLPDSTEQQGQKKSDQMNAVDRGLMLGETPILGSVFDLIQKEDKNRIEATKQAIAITQSLANKAAMELTSKFHQSDNSNAPGHSVEAPDQSKNTFLSKFKPASSTATVTEPVSDSQAKAPLFQGSLNFQPFRKDPVKQERYDRYLALLKQGVKEPYASVAGSHMTEWERARERDEFAKASKIFRPMSAMMSSRFVRGAMIDDEHTQGPSNSSHEVSDQAKAASMNMYGKLTREEFEWHPDNLLCKRFNVPNPYPGSDIVGLPTVKRDKLSVFNFLDFGDYQSGDIQEPTLKKTEPEVQAPALKPKPTLASVFKVLDDPDFDKPTYKPGSRDKEDNNTDQPKKDEDEEADDDTPPDIDLFRAIFKNSDSEDSKDESEKEIENDSSDEEMETKPEADKKQQEDKEELNSVTEEVIVKPEPSEVKVTDELINTSTPTEGRQEVRHVGRTMRKSIFSVIDHLDDPVCTSDKHPTTDLVEQVTVIEEDVDEYGPKLPPSSSSNTQSHTFESNTPILSTKKNKDKERKHKHKKEKKKKSKSKKERKHKKHKKSGKSKKAYKDSSGSDADTESDSADSDISDTELLKKLKQVAGKVLDVH